MKKTFLIFNLILLPALASSDLYQENEDINKILEQNMYEPNYFSMLLGLIVVIALIYITAIVYQKLTKINLKEESNGVNKIDIISTTSLGQGRNLHIIKVNGEYSLIGATQNQITHIKDFPQDYVERLKKRYNSQGEYRA